MRGERRAGGLLLSGLVAATLAVACASPQATRIDGDTYIRWTAFPVPGHESVVLRWPRRRMPLRVYLTRPPARLFQSPDAIYAAARRGILAWSGVAGPDLPSFVFVDVESHADIPFVWESKPSGRWDLAHCVYHIQSFTRRFGVSRILLIARWPNGHRADPTDIEAATMHEMGHALGIGGHSPDPADIMYRTTVGKRAPQLSARDRATMKLLYALPIGTPILGAQRDHTE